MGQTIYCISGLGADEKIFENLQLSGYELKYLPWLKPEKKETIASYAARMAAYIEDDVPVLLGVSFGGMVGIEIARQMPVRKLFIISSIKLNKELPRWMKWAGVFSLNRLIPARSYTFTEKLDNKRLGVSNEKEKEMAKQYRQNADREYIDWAIHEIINWKNDWLPEQIVHIHGKKDKIFPLKNIKAAHHLIPDGTHMMIYNRAQEISEIIMQELR